MIETVKVLSANGERVEVQCLKNSACEGCGSKGFCTTTARKFTARNKENLELSPGDIVTIDLEGSKAIGYGFMVLIFPLLMFLILFLTAQKILPESSEIIHTLLGLTGLGGGFLIAWGITKLLGKKGWPVILEKL